MKRTIKKLLTVLVVIILVYGLAGCDGKHKIYEDGYFQYIIVGEYSRFPKNKSDEIVSIIGLTDLGKTQETIDIPRSIDGKEVKRLGYSIDNRLMGTMYYQFESLTLKKIYIHDNILVIYPEIFNQGDLDIMVCEARNHEKGESSVFSNIYIYREIYNSVEESSSTKANGTNWYIWTKNTTTPANIVFVNNYSDEINAGYYRLDNIKSGEKIPYPPTPERDGYEFVGWFTEPECLNIWDFTNEKVFDEDDEFRLFAGWREI